MYFSSLRHHTQAFNPLILYAIVCSVPGIQNMVTANIAGSCEEYRFNSLFKISNFAKIFVAIRRTTILSTAIPRNLLFDETYVSSTCNFNLSFWISPNCSWSLMLNFQKLHFKQSAGFMSKLFDDCLYFPNYFWSVADSKYHNTASPVVLTFFLTGLFWQDWNLIHSSTHMVYHDN